MNNSNFLESVTVKPTRPAIGSVIWLHGLGADGHDFTDIVPQLNLPDNLPIRFTFPHAPVRPVVINANMRMRAWFDIYSLENLEKEDEVGILEAQRAVTSLINQEILAGIPSDRIVLAGFSQGGAMALHSGLRYEKSLAGIIGLSTYLPLAKKLSHEASNANKQTPILIAHGRFDPVLPIILGQRTYELLKQLDYPAEWHDYPMEHQVCFEEIKMIGKWLETIYKSTMPCRSH